MTVIRKKVRRKSADVIAPTGKWVARTPSAGATVSGTIYLDLLAIDNRAMTSVTFYMNGSPAGTVEIPESSSRGGVYSLAVNTTAWPNGAYNVSAYLRPGEGPGMTKNLGTITIDNAAVPSLAITSHSSGDTVTLPFMITVAVSPAGQEYNNISLDGNGEIESLPTEINPDVWAFPISTFYQGNQTVAVAPFITLGGSARIYGPTVNLTNGSYYSTVSVSYAISDTTVNAGDTVTITPTITGDATDLVLTYDFADQQAAGVERSGATVVDSVEHIYTVPGTFTPAVAARRSGSIVDLQYDTLSAITVSPVVGADTVAPSVSISTPANGATVSGALSYEYSVSDAVGVIGVAPILNGVTQQIIGTPAPVTLGTITASVDTRQYDDGALTIGGTAYDAAGNAGTAATITVTIDNVPDTPPPQSDDWYEWPVAPTLTETRRNLSGSSKDYAPISFMMTYNPGEVTTAHTLQLKDPTSTIVPTTDWQWGDRVTHPDGSLSSCIVRCYGPVGWADSGSAQYTVEVISGSWPAETDSRPLSIVASNSDYWIELDDITEPENHAAFQSLRRTQAAYANPTLEYRNNRALARAFVPKKETGGSIYTRFYTWEWLKTPGGTNDTQMAAKCWTEVWCAPGTNTVRHMSHDALILNGMGKVFGRAKLAKVRVMNGLSVLKNWSTTINRTVSDIVARPEISHWYWHNDLIDYSTFKFGPGNGVKVTGSPPSGLTAGKIYQNWPFAGGSVPQMVYLSPGAPAQGYGGLKHGFGKLGQWTAYGTPTDPGTGGGTFTLTSYTNFLDKRMYAIRDENGSPFWTVGGAIVEPYWTTAEKKRRMNTGQIPSIPIDVPSTVNQIVWYTLLPNTPKNTSNIPSWLQYFDYQPGVHYLHRNVIDEGGTTFSHGYHLNECSMWMWDLLNDMANPSVPFWRQQRMAAAESICIPTVNTNSVDLDSNGIECMTVAVVNNGPNKNGTRYPGMGSCNYTAWSLSGNNPIQDAAGGGVGGAAYGTEFQQNEMQHVSGGNASSGSHSSKEPMFSYVLRCFPGDLEFTQHFAAYIVSRVPHDGVNPLFGRNKVHNGTSYYGCIMLGTGDPYGQPRIWIGANYFLSFALYTPDAHVASQYFKDMAADSVNYLAAVYDDPAVIGSRAKSMGPMQTMPGGGQQGWVLGRHSTAASYLLKRSGITGSGAEKALKYITAFPRMLWGHPEGGGQVHKQAEGAGGYNGYNGFVALALMYDYADPAEGFSGRNTSSRALNSKFLDAAHRGATDSRDFTFHGPDGVVYFETDGNEIRFTWPTQQVVSYPNNGDQMAFVPNDGGSGTPPAGVSWQVFYYLYDRVTVGNGTFRFKLSTTYPSITPVTWSIGSEVLVYRNNLVTRHANKIIGTLSNGMLPVNQGQTNFEYIVECTGSMLVARTLFGAEHCIDAANAFATWRGYIQSAQGVDVRCKSQVYGWAMLESHPPGM